MTIFMIVEHEIHFSQVTTSETNDCLQGQYNAQRICSHHQCISLSLSPIADYTACSSMIG